MTVYSSSDISLMTTMTLISSLRTLLYTAVFNKHVVKFVGTDKYVQDSDDGEVKTPK
jgi:hypothetical protein